MADIRVGYLPSELVDELRHWAPPEVSGSEMYSLERIAELVWASGYEEGRRRGVNEGLEYGRRPNINDVNRLREALVAERKSDVQS